MSDRQGNENHDVTVGIMIDPDDDERIGLSGRDAEQQFMRLARAYNEMKAQRDQLRDFVRGVIRYAGNAGDDYLADKARAALAEIGGQDENTDND